MPVKRKTVKRTKGGRRKLDGSRLKKAMSKINKFLKKSKLISNVAFAVDSLGYPVAKQVGSVASNLGYGRRKRVAAPKRKKRGGGLAQAGGSVFATRVTGRGRGGGLRRAGRGVRRGTKKTSFP